MQAIVRCRSSEIAGMGISPIKVVLIDGIVAPTAMFLTKPFIAFEER